MIKANISAACYFKPDYYNHTLRATVPGCWVVRLDDLLPSQVGCPIIPEFYGNTRRDAIVNCIEILRDTGLTGNLHLHS